MNSVRATAAAAAQALNAARQHHKREADHHRRAARKAAQQLDELRRNCEALGIPLQIIDTEPEGGPQS
jgi:transcription initiation factor TFIIIB Brf1 subunit/transcription initiation factor TFIIB